MMASQLISQLKRQLDNAKYCAEGRDTGAQEGDYGWSPALEAIRKLRDEHAELVDSYQEPE